MNLLSSGKVEYAETELSDICGSWMVPLRIMVNFCTQTRYSYLFILVCESIVVNQCSFYVWKHQACFIRFLIFYREVGSLSLFTSCSLCKLAEAFCLSNLILWLSLMSVCTVVLTPCSSILSLSLMSLCTVVLTPSRRPLWAALKTSWSPLGDTFWVLDGLMDASWSLWEGPWAAKPIFERFGSDFDSQK